MKNIYIDDGSTGIKLAWKDGNGEIKTALTNNTFKKELSPPTGESQVYNYRCTGEDFSFSPMSTSIVMTNNVQWQYSAANAVAIQHALQQSGLVPQPIHALVTLPLSEFYDHNNQPNLVNIEKKKASVAQAVEVLGGQAFIIEKVSVSPESIPAAVAKVAELTDLDALLVVDLGGTTLDVSLIQGETASLVRVEGNASIGASAVTREVDQALRAANGQSSWRIADAIVKNRHNNEFIAARLFKEEDLPTIREALDKSIVSLSNATTDFLTRFSGFTHVAVVGGGASLVADRVKESLKISDKRFFVSNDPQFDLVRGMLYISGE